MIIIILMQINSVYLFIIFLTNDTFNKFLKLNMHCLYKYKMKRYD